MEVITLLLYVGAVWVSGAIVLFMWNVKSHGHEHEDRLAILPLEDNWTDPLRVRAPSSSQPGKHEPS